MKPRTETGREAVRLRGLFGGETEERASEWVRKIEAEAAQPDGEALPSGARLSLQKGDDYGNGPWYAVVENTIDLPDQDTARLGSGQTPQEAMDAAISRYARLAEGTDR